MKNNLLIFILCLTIFSVTCLYTKDHQTKNFNPEVNTKDESQSERIYTFDQSYQYPVLNLMGNNLYITDAGSCQIFIFRLKDFKFLGKFGKRGEGPGEFKYMPHLSFKQNRLEIFNKGKISSYSMLGELLKEKKIDNSLSWVQILNNRLVARRLKNSPDGKTFSWQWSIFKMGGDNLLIKDFLKITHGHFPKNKPGKKTWNIPSVDVSIKVYKEKIIIGDPRKKFLFSILDNSGILIKSFTYDYKRIQVSETIKNSLLKEFQEQLGAQMTASHQKRFAYKFPDFLPPFDTFKVDSDRIYVFTYATQKKKRLTLVFNLEGKLVGKAYLYLQREGSIHSNYYYSMIDNQKDDCWELHRERIL